MLKHLWQMKSALALSFILIFSLDAIPTQLMASKQQYASVWAGGDLVVKQHKYQEIESLETEKTSMSIKLSTMMLANDQVYLVHLQLIDDQYPLYGALEANTDTPIPEDGVWVDQVFAGQVGLAMGDTVIVGERTLVVSGLTSQQDEQIFDFEAFSPSVFVRYDQAKSLGLISETSRLHHYTYISTDSPGQLSNKLQALLPKDAQVIQPKESLGRVERVITQVAEILGVLRFVGYIMAGFLVHLALEHYCHYYARESGILMALGRSRFQRVTYLVKPIIRSMVEALLIGVCISLLLTGVLDYVLEQLPVRMSYSWLELITRTLMVFLPIFITLVVVHIGSVVSMQAILLLNRKPRSINHFLMFLSCSLVAVYASYVDWRAQDVMLYVILSSVVFLLLYLVVFGVLKLVMSLLQKGGTRSLLLLSGMRLHKYEYTFMVLFISMMISAGLFLWHVQTQTIPTWQDTLPQQSANSFMIGVQPGQVSQLQQEFDWLADTPFYPIVKGRLLSINGVDSASYQGGGYADHESFNRQLNLTMLNELPNSNETIAGEWPSDGISGDQGIMRRLGLELGDTLTFLIFGEEVTLPITSIRAVDWQSMRANFYFIFPPSALEHFPASCLANTYLPDDRRDDLVDLRLGYPNITILDVAVFVAQAQGFISAITYTVGVFIGVLSLFGLMAFLMVLSRQSEQKAEQELAMQRLGLSVKDYPVMRDELSCVLGIATIFSMTVGAGLVMAVNQFLSVKWQFDWYSYVILIAPWALILPYVLIRNHPKLIEGEL